ncbi:MAG: acylphosphatase [Bryobacteraceae bacterium]
MPDELIAQRFVVHGRVQGVGFRHFTLNAANRHNVSGYARNLADGSVEVYARGTAAQLSELAGSLRTGPPFSDVRWVDVSEAALEKHTGFRIR